MQWLSRWTYKFSVLLLVLLFTIMVVAILLEVFAHNFLNHSFIWSGELAQYCFVWITFIGASAVYKHNEMIGFDTLLSKLPAKHKKSMTMFIQVIIIGFSIVFMYYGYKKAFSPSVMVQMSTGFRVPMLVPYISIPLGMLMLFIHATADLLTNRKKEEA